MKLKFLLILLILPLCFSSVAVAADKDDQMTYKIVSYNFSSDDPGAKFSSFTFGPLLITGSTADILTSTPFSNFGSADPKTATDIFALAADFSPTPTLSLHGAFGITKNRWNAASDPHYESGWEANLGIIYKLFDNISYEMHFGYMDPGDLFKESNTSYTDVESIIMINNKLTLSF